MDSMRELPPDRRSAQVHIVSLDNDMSIQDHNVNRNSGTNVRVRAKTGQGMDNNVTEGSGTGQELRIEEVEEVRS